MSYHAPSGLNWGISRSRRLGGNNFASFDRRAVAPIERIDGEVPLLPAVPR
jgi:hypothetical protein